MYKRQGLEFAGRVDFGTIYNTAHNVYLLGSYTNLFTAKFKKDAPNEGVISGDRLPYAPRHLASLSVGYQHPVGVDARLGVDYVSSQEPDAWTNTLTGDAATLTGLTGNIPSYSLFNASVNFKPVNSQFTYFLSGHNLTDREYLASRVAVSYTHLNILSSVIAGDNEFIPQAELQQIEINQNVAMNKLFEELEIPYQAFEVNSEAGLKHAVAEIARMTNKPTRYEYRLPRQDYAVYLYLLSMFLLGSLFWLKQIEIKAWKA